MDKLRLYHNFSKTALGRELMGWLHEQYDRKIEAAAKSTSPDEAFGLLKNAHGILEVIRHLESRDKES